MFCINQSTITYWLKKSIRKLIDLCYYHVTYGFQSESSLYSLPECQETPCSMQALYLTFKWHQRDSNPQPLGSWKNTQSFCQTEHLAIWPVWLNGWVFGYKLNGCGFESRCCHLRKSIFLKYSFFWRCTVIVNLKKISRNTIFSSYIFGIFYIVKFKYFSRRPNKMK